MTSYSTTYKTVDLVYCGVPLKVIGVEFFPAVGATDETLTWLPVPSRESETA